LAFQAERVSVLHCQASLQAAKELRLKNPILPGFDPLRMDMVTTREVQRFHTKLASERTPATAKSLAMTWGVGRRGKGHAASTSLFSVLAVSPCEKE
jgi:hypothetical protein